MDPVWNTEADVPTGTGRQLRGLLALSPTSGYRQEHPAETVAPARVTRQPPELADGLAVRAGADLRHHRDHDVAQYDPCEPYRQAQGRLGLQDRGHLRNPF